MHGVFLLTYLSIYLLLRALYGLATAHAIALLCIVNWYDSAVFHFCPW